MLTRNAELTVTANDQSRLFGQANPPLTYELSGFVGGETASVVSGTASCSTVATPSSPAGDYPIICSAGSLSAPGYTVARFVAGTLTVAYSKPCSTAPSAGPLRVASGQNVIIGPARVTDNTGGVDVSGNRVIGPLNVTGNASPVHATDNSVTGRATIQS
jgi:hypothetical protein